MAVDLALAGFPVTDLVKMIEGAISEAAGRAGACPVDTSTPSQLGQVAGLVGRR